MKKKGMKAILVSALTVFICLVFVQAVCAGVTASGSCGAQENENNVIWTLNDEGVLVVSGSGDMTDGPTFAWDAYRAEITKVVFTSGVTHIGAGAFNGCAALSEISLPESITTIGDFAFAGCTSLTALTVPDGVISLGADVFAGCTSLRSLTAGKALGCCRFSHIESLQTLTVLPSAKHICAFAFEGCSGLTELQLPDEAVSIGAYAFKDCTGLRALTLPDQVETVAYTAFTGCTGVTALTVGKAVENTDFMCLTNLQTVTVTQAAEAIGPYAFSDCAALRQITLPDKVKRIGSDAFAGCVSLTQLTLPASLEDIGDYAFWNCTGLTSLTIPDSVRNLGRATFSGCSGITSLTVGKAIETCRFSDLINLTRVTITDGPESIAASAFSGCSALLEIVIPDTVVSIGRFAFANTAWLAAQPDGIVYAGQVVYGIKGDVPEDGAVVIRDDVTGIADGAFKDATWLTEITLPDSLETIGDHAFENCSGLTEIVIPEGVTSIGDAAFKGCTGLTSVEIPDSVTELGNSAFEGCTGLTDVVIGTGVTTIGDAAFKNCENLQTVLIPEGVESIGSEAFAGCASLSQITIPNSVSFIGENVFDGCHLKVLTVGKIVETRVFSDMPELEEVIILSGVTCIAPGAFASHPYLQRLTLPVSVVKIGEAAFDDCGALADVYYAGTQTQWNKILIGSRNDALTRQATVHYKHGEHLFEGEELRQENGETYCVAVCTICGLERKEKVDYTVCSGETFGYSQAGTQRQYAAVCEDACSVVFSQTPVENLRTENGFVKGTAFSFALETVGLHRLHITDGRADKTLIVCVREHVWDAGQKMLAPTCTQDGLVLYTCTLCGLKSEKPDPAFGHDYGAWEFLDEKQHIRVCVNDDSHIEQADHDWKIDKILRVSTVMEAGEMHCVCTVCGAERIASMFLLGDVDFNGRIEAADARLALRAAVGLEDYPAGSNAFQSADVDFDGKLTAADARLILRVAVGLEFFDA